MHLLQAGISFALDSASLWVVRVSSARSCSRPDSSLCESELFLGVSCVISLSLYVSVCCFEHTAIVDLFACLTPRA